MRVYYMVGSRSTIQRRLLGVGTLLIAFAVTACGGGQSPQQNGSTAAKLLFEATKTAESVASAVGESLGVPAAEATPSTPTPTQPAPAIETPVVRRRPRPAPSPTQAATAEVAAPVTAAIVEIPAVEPEPEPASLVEEAPEVLEALDYTVYSSEDTDVVPPTPPVASGLRPWRIKAGPAVEVIVASDGTVEKVQVLGTTRMSDAMVLSHVKAWKFAPALRGGDPVRYRLLLDDPVVAP